MQGVTHTGVTDDAATIHVPALCSGGSEVELRLWHLSDSHIDRGTDLGRESSNMNFGERMHELWRAGRAQRATGQVLRPDEVPTRRPAPPRRPVVGEAHLQAAQLLSRLARWSGGLAGWLAGGCAGAAAAAGARAGAWRDAGAPLPALPVHPAVALWRRQVVPWLSGGVGLGRVGATQVCHTGNLVNFPSFRAVAHAEALLHGGGLPFCFVAGAHDWTWEEATGTTSQETQRRQYRPLVTCAAAAPMFVWHPCCVLLAEICAEGHIQSRGTGGGRCFVGNTDIAKGLVRCWVVCTLGAIVNPGRAGVCAQRRRRGSRHRRVCGWWGSTTPRTTSVTAALGSQD
jgi:hypothetical protein